MQYFLGNPKVGGVGIDLYTAERVYYYSNSYALEDRIQSEDRAHRIGLRNPIEYEDFIALETVEERIIQALRDKQEVATIIYGDVLR